MALLHHRRTEDDIDLRDRELDRSRRRDPRTDDPYVDRDGRGAAPAGVDERTSVTAHDGWNSVVRAVAIAAAGVATVMGAVALFRIDWTDGLDSAAVDVAGVTFGPAVALVTVVAGVVSVLAAATSGRGSKLVVGGVLAVVGVAILVIGAGDRADLGVERAHGWLALGVGAVLLLSGLLIRRSWTARRRTSTGRT